MFRDVEILEPWYLTRRLVACWCLLLGVLGLMVPWMYWKILELFSTTGEAPVHWSGRQKVLGFFGSLFCFSIGGYWWCRGRNLGSSTRVLQKQPQVCFGRLEAGEASVASSSAKLRRVTHLRITGYVSELRV